MAKMSFDFSKFDNMVEASIKKAGIGSKKVVEEVCQKIYDESQKEVPVDTGALQSTGRIEIERKLLGYKGQVRYGGTGAINPKTGVSVDRYALRVHEDLNVFHPTGKAKFLEDPTRRVQEEMEDIASGIFSQIFGAFRR